MKIYLIIIILLCGNISNAQSLQFGIIRNYTHLTQRTTTAPNVDRNDRSRISLYIRYQRQKGFFLFRNNELGIDFNTASIDIETQSSLGGAGGQDLRLDYSTLSLTINNYLLNCNVLDKRLQLGIGLHYNYKLKDYISGEYTDSEIGWNSSGVYFTWYKYSFSKYHRPEVRKFNLGLCATAGTVFSIGKHQFSIRYTIQRALREDVIAPNTIGVSYLRQNLGLYIVRKHF